MARVVTNYPPVRYSNSHGPVTTSLLSRSSSNSSSVNGNNLAQTVTTPIARPIMVRSAAPVPVQKETVHACPLCNGEYKDPRVLPCTHTFCLNCIREKLINNALLTCPKCQHQTQPFDETQLSELPRNLILSQEWRMNARLPPTLPKIKKPVTYQPPVLPANSMTHQQDKRRSITSENISQDGSVNSTTSQGVATLVNNFNKSLINGSDDPRSSRASSATSNQLRVSNLAQIYSEVSGSKPQQQQPKSRGSSVASSAKHDELVRIFEQMTNRSPHDSVTPTAHAHELAYDEIRWDTSANRTTPAAPPLPEQLQAVTVHYEQVLEPPQRPSSVASLPGHRHEMITGIPKQPVERVSSPYAQALVQDVQIPSRPSTASRSYHGSDDGDDADDEDPPGQRMSVPQIIYATIPTHDRSRQGSYNDSVRSGSTSRQSPLPPPLITPQRQGEISSHRTASASSSIRRSYDQFPPPPPSHNMESLDFSANAASKRQSISSISNHSSNYSHIHEPIPNNETAHLLTQRFDPNAENSSRSRVNSGSVGNSHRTSGALTPTNRPPSVSVDQSHSRQDQTYLVPLPSTSITPTVTSRVDLLLSDQKRLERDIEERMKRLKHDYDDIRAQINRKESAIHNEVKNITGRLNDDITEHYQRKQTIYAKLAADANNARSELENLRANTHTDNNKQQLWANLEQIESNIQNIRRAVEQQKGLSTSLTFAEGHRSLGIDTIGQLTLNQIDSRPYHHSSPSPPKASPPQRNEQLSTNISPYKYMKIDHLSSLEPEAIAITDNNKKILLGICNKLFILDEHGETLKIIPLSPSIRGIAISKKSHLKNIAYVSHDETVSMIDIDNGQTLDSVKETESSEDSGTFLPLGIDTDNIRGDVYVCDYRNSCVIKFDEKLEFITQWRIYNHSEQYDEARPKLISVYGQRLYMIVEHSCKPYYNQGIAYTFSLHICDANSGNIIKIVDSELLATQRLRWPCSVQAINHDKCCILDTMTSGKYFNGQWQKHWSRVLEIGQDDSNVVTELFQLDSEAATMAMTKENMIIAANGDVLFVDLGFLKSTQIVDNHRYHQSPDRTYQNLT